MARTIGECIANARTLLQDNAQPYRVSDDEIYTAFNNAMLEARRLRPDLFYATMRVSMPVYSIADIGVAFPIDEQYWRTIVDYIVSEAETRNEEFTTDDRASAMLTLFTRRLIGQGI